MRARFGRLPPLNGLRVFEVAARHLNFRLAAEELGVTQGAVAQQVRGLEAQLRLALFERQPRKLALTDAGRSYVASIRHALDLIAEATEALRPAVRHVTISVTPTFASRWLIPRLSEFTSAHPDIDLRILATDRIADFRSDAVDLAVRFAAPPFGSGLAADLLFDHPIVAVGSPLLIARSGDPRDGDNLRHYTLLHDAHGLWPDYLELAMPGAAANPPKNLHFNQTGLAIDAALAGQGLALANLLFVRNELASGRLVQAFPAELRARANFYVVAPRRPRHPELALTVGDWLVGEARRDQG